MLLFVVIEMLVYCLLVFFYIKVGEIDVKMLNFLVWLGVFLVKIDFRFFESWMGNNIKKIDDVCLNCDFGLVLVIY